MRLKNETKILYYENDETSIIVKSLNVICDFFKEKKIEIFVHNLNFDGLLLINEISKNLIKYDLKSNKTNLFYIEIFYLNKTIKFRCSYKILPLSLKKIGEIENFPKSSFPHKFAKKETLFYKGPFPPENFWEDLTDVHKKNENEVFDFKNEAIRYCSNDAILTQCFLLKILSLINSEMRNIAVNHHSAPSISHKLFYEKYNIKKIPEKMKKKDEQYVRNSYFGGRCEVFGNPYENEHVKYFDFAGMYGLCMLENFHNGEGFYSSENDTAVPGFHTVEYYSNFSYLPVLPSHSSTGKLLFANEKKIGTFWFEELEFFKKKGGIVLRHLHSYVYKKYEPVFKDFVEKFNEFREMGGYYKVFGKLMINSLYGGLALNSVPETLYITFSEKEFFHILQNMNVSNFYKMNQSYIILIKKDYKSFKFFNSKLGQYSERNVSYASAIAAKARIKLYLAMETVLNDGGRLLYCDTDSIFAAYAKSNNSVKTSSFEWLKTYNDAVFVAPKVYALKGNVDEIKIKGIGFKDKNFNEIKESFYKDDFLTFSNQLYFKKFNFKLKQEYLKKNISLSSYDKRIFTHDKKNTTPLFLN